MNITAESLISFQDLKCVRQLLPSVMLSAWKKNWSTKYERVKSKQCLPQKLFDACTPAQASKFLYKPAQALRVVSRICIGTQYQRSPMIILRSFDKSGHNCTLEPGQ